MDTDSFFPFFFSLSKLYNPQARIKIHALKAQKESNNHIKQIDFGCLSQPKVLNRYEKGKWTSIEMDKS